MKRKLFHALIFILAVSCNTKNEIVQYSPIAGFAPFPLEVPEQQALMTSWEAKKVLKTELVDDMEKGTGWTVTGIGEMSYTQERAHDGQQSLRFRTSLRDTAYYKRNRTEWNSFGGRQGGLSYVERLFKQPQDWSAFNRLSFWVYVHPTSMPTYCIHIKISCEGAVGSATNHEGRSHFVQDLKPGEWNHVMFEIPHLKRDKVTDFTIYQMLRGHNPEEEGIVTYDIDQLEIQLVEQDHYEGWEVADGKIAYSHVGYRTDAPKIALAGAGSGATFELVNKENKTVFTNTVQHIENKEGKFQLLNFSDFLEPGEYRLICGKLETNPFPIHDDIWIQPIFKTLNGFFCLRCGFNVPGVHLECHKDWQGFRGEEKKIINGGWHDAGDLSQGSWRTSMSSLAMMMNLENLERKQVYPELAERLRTEIAWGLEWLLKTRFGDGYHMSFSVQRIYSDNQIGTIDDVVSPAKNVPWENFLAAAVQCKAGMMLKNTHPELAEQSRMAAVEDWQAAVASREVWDHADYRVAAWGATSSILLQQMTGEEQYAEQAALFGQLVVQCQEQRFVNEIPITGYFYTNTDKDQVIHNYHAAFEEAPLIALAMLCASYPDHDDWMMWYYAAALHSEFFLKRGCRIAAPYDLLPNSVWKKSEIMAIEDEQQRSDMLRQFNDGTLLKDEYVLRTFPIYRDNLFHGNTNIHMSSTWALAEASRLRNDQEGMKLVGTQLEWIFGANPFGQSLMYGEGYDFAPHFAYCLKDIVGALPVGMDCMSGDAPQWSATNNATYKEIWVEPMNRFLGAVSIYDSEMSSQAQAQDADLMLQTRVETAEENMFKVFLRAEGSGIHQLEIRAFNAETEFELKEIDLTENKNAPLELEFKINDRTKPYVVVFIPDQTYDLGQEIVGSVVAQFFSPM